MNKITHKERIEKNNIVCPNCHTNIKVLTDDLILPLGDEWHDDMYISHEAEYLERKELQERIDKAIEYIMTELITEWDIKNDGYVSGSDLPVEVITPLLNILKGNKNER